MSGPGSALYLTEALAIHAAGEGPETALAAVAGSTSIAVPHSSFGLPGSSGDSEPVLHAPCGGLFREDRIPQLLGRLLSALSRAAGSAPSRAAWLVLPEQTTPRGAGLPVEELLTETAQALGCVCRPVSGESAAAVLDSIAQWLAAEMPGARAWLLGVDSLLDMDTLMHLGRSGTLARPGAEGLLPGEAAAAVALSRAPAPGREACIRGWSSRPEPAAAAQPAQGRFKGLSAAVAAALAQASIPPAAVQGVMTMAAAGAAGELEWAQCAARTWPTTLTADQRHAIELGLMQAPADAGRQPSRLAVGSVLGEVGAGWLPLVLGLAGRARHWQARWAVLGVESEPAPIMLLCRHLGSGSRDVVVVV